MAPADARADPWPSWEPRLLRLCDAVREATRAALADAAEAGERERVAAPRGRGAGDVTYGLDVPGERAIAAWHREVAAREPLSVLTEDAGWRHLGPAPDGSGRAVELPGFDHGGPRVAFDPVDGTRNLMADLRSAWTVVSFAPPGPGPPRLAELSAGIVAELPPTRAGRWRVLVGRAGGGCRIGEGEADAGAGAGAPPELRPHRVDEDDRVDGGYFPVFRYTPAQRPAIADLEAAFFARLEREEGACVRDCWDDQYVSNAGQLVLLALGTYRMVVDPRALVAERLGVAGVTAKPYDLAGAVVCARAAGAEVRGADGEPLDFPVDAETPVHFAGWANAATRRRLEPHWIACVRAACTRAGSG